MKYPADIIKNGTSIKTRKISIKAVLYMKTFNIMLKSINDVKDFVNIANKYDFDVDLTSGRYIVDAKSIMGIFSLDLSKPIKVEVHTDGTIDDFMEEVKPFTVD
jgi:phosphocarrier protein HPr